MQGALDYFQKDKFDYLYRQGVELERDKKRMFLVGHAMVAFLIAYLISERARGKALGDTRISFALVMLIGVLPDIDMVFQAVGIMPHKTFTHSLVVSAMIVAPAIFAAARWPLHQTMAASLAYALAYAQHMLDDIVVGTLNVAYPLGNIPVGIGIAYGSLYHLILECALVSVVACIVVSRSFGDKRRWWHDHDSLFAFRGVDKICYALLILSFIVSFAYLLHEMKSIPRLFIESELDIALFVLLHISALALASFLLFVSSSSLLLSKKRRSEAREFHSEEEEGLSDGP